MPESRGALPSHLTLGIGLKVDTLTEGMTANNSYSSAPQTTTISGAAGGRCQPDLTLLTV